jgi:cobalt-zinc-cadmium efflux system outer membrane protein
MKFSTCIGAGVLVAVVSNAVWISGTHAQTEIADTGSLALIVNRSLERNADVSAAQAAVQAAEARLQGAAQPLNNPELAGEAEHTDINTYKLGIFQTIDWHDKRTAFEQVAQAELQVSQQQLAATRLTTTTELLDAIGRIAIQQAVNRLSRHQVEILTDFSKVATQRHSAGDISRAELELARLSLAEASMKHARNSAELVVANSDFFALSGQILSEDIQLPKQLSLLESTSGDLESIIQKHPKVQTAMLKSQVAKRQINATDKERKADPTLGITAGREDNNNLLALNFSIPLQIRNSYQSNVDVANAEALRTEKEAQQIYRSLHAELMSANRRYEIISSAWTQWLKQGHSSLQQRIRLLDTLWRAGEINTSDYLLQVQQTLNTQIAGIQLHADLWQTWLDWMSTSASLNTWLNKNLRNITNENA